MQRMHELSITVPMNSPKMMNFFFEGLDEKQRSFKQLKTNSTKNFCIDKCLSNYAARS
jgi:hypothetical protein